jgi:phage tail sheath protein FI
VFIGSDDGQGNLTGLQALNKVDEVSIVCIPGVTSKKVQMAMIAHCVSMKCRFCILDPEKDDDIDDIKKQRDGLVSEKGFAALYHPWIKVDIEREDGKNIKRIQKFVPPSGHIAGIYARTDIEQGVHKAPANMNVKGALGLKVALTQSEQDILNSNEINCILTFPGKDFRVWGARTIANNGKWKYISVRRFFIFLEKSIDKGIQWAVFEPNDTPLWVRVKNDIS